MMEILFRRRFGHCTMRSKATGNKGYRSEGVPVDNVQLFVHGQPLTITGEGT
jgi:hypothetical protein